MESNHYAVRNIDDDSVIVWAQSLRDAVRFASEVRRGDFDNNPRDCWVSEEGEQP